MAVLDLGLVTFGLGADTRGLEKSVQKLNEFTRVVDKAARSQTEGSKRAVSALARQEDAIKKALEQTRLMQRELKAAGAQPQVIGKQTIAFRQFTQGMSQTNLGFRENLKLNRRFQRSMNRSRLALRGLKTGRAAKGLNRMTEVMRDLESASVLAVGPLSGIGARIRAIGAIANRSTLLIVGLVAGITGLIVVFVKLFSASVRARVQMDKIMGAMQQATGAAVFARKEFEFVTAVANRMGQRIADSAESFAQFAASARDTAIEGEGVRIVFEGVLSAVTALKLPLETQTGLFRALTQMMSKGVIQSEELRGQFGERLAGAFEIVRKKIGETNFVLKTTLVDTKNLGAGFQTVSEKVNLTRAAFAKMLKEGKLISDKFIIPIGEAMQETFGKQALKSADTFTSSVNRMSNAQFEFNLALEKLIDTSGVAIGAVDALTGAINFLKDNLEAFLATLGAVTVGILGLFAPGVLAGLAFLGRGIRKAAIAMAGLNAVMLANPAVALTKFVLRLGIAVVAGTAAFFGFKSMLTDTGEAMRLLMQDVDELLEIEQLRTEQQRKTTQETLKNLKIEVEAIEVTLEARKALAASLDVGIVGFTGETTFGKELQRDIDTVAEGIVKIKGLQALLDKGLKAPEIDIGDVPDKVEKLFTAMQQAQAQVRNIGKDVALDPEFIEALFDAQDIIKELSEKDLLALQIRLEEMGFTSKALDSLIVKLRQMGFETKGITTVGDALAQLTTESIRAETEWKKLLKAFERTPKIVRGINRDVDQMRRLVVALGRGSGAVEKLNDAFEREDALEAYRKKLEKLTEAGRKSVLTLEEFNAILDELQAGEDRLENIVKPLEDAFTSAFDSIGDSIVEAFERGAVSLESLRDLANTVFAEIFKAILDITLIQPIKDVISGGAGAGSLLGGLLFGGGGGAGPGAGPGSEAAGGLGFFASIASFFGFKKGGAFSGGIRKFAGGGILDGPTLFPISGGNIGLGGEAGTEAILPLARTPSGDLGVKTTGPVQGPSGGNTFNFIFPANTNVREFGRSRGRMAQIAMEVASMGSKNA